MKDEERIKKQKVRGQNMHRFKKSAQAVTQHELLANFHLNFRTQTAD
jgi:hypothetical protein